MDWFLSQHRIYVFVSEEIGIFQKQANGFFNSPMCSKGAKASQQNVYLTLFSFFAVLSVIRWGDLSTENPSPPSAMSCQSVN